MLLLLSFNNKKIKLDFTFGHSIESFVGADATFFPTFFSIYFQSFWIQCIFYYLTIKFFSCLSQ